MMLLLSNFHFSAILLLLFVNGGAEGMRIVGENNAGAKKPQRTLHGCASKDGHNFQFRLPAGSRRDLLRAASMAAVASRIPINVANAADLDSQSYNQRFPTLFDPIYGHAEGRRTIKRQIGPNIWCLEQNLQLGPLQTPLRCVVIRLENGGLWVQAPLAPTNEFFELVESCGDGVVEHVVVPSYALEHKIFVKDAINRWKDAKLWTSPGQFSFPLRSASEEFVFGKGVDGVLSTSAFDYDYDVDGGSETIPPWANEIQYDTLAAGTFNLAGVPTTFYETAFFHKKTKSLIVTDAVAKITKTIPDLNDPELLLLVSKRSTSDPQPEDTPTNRLAGWEKTCLLVSYFFPEHEEPDPEKLGVVTWTDGWEDNFDRLSNRLLVPPVVRTLIYAQNPTRVKEWVNRVASRWDFVQIIPAHFDAPIAATPEDFRRAFTFLDDDAVDAFPARDLERGLRPIADLALGRSQNSK